MSWLNKILNKSSNISKKEKEKIPDGIWKQCPKCQNPLYVKELKQNLNVCPKCNHHLTLSARDRIGTLLDNEAEIIELGVELEPQDILKFKDTKRYKDRITSAQKNSNEKDAMVTCKGTINGIPAVVAAFEFSFMGGSMASVVGEKFVQSIECCLKENRAFICVSISGGARMQESLISLFQMAKTSAALNKMDEKKLPYISILTNPTMGGVSASLAMLGDVIIAEPDALIGFAGPRVIEQTIRESLPEGFQKSEFLLKHGAIDLICERKNMKQKLTSILKKFMQSGLKQSA